MALRTAVKPVFFIDSLVNFAECAAGAVAYSVPVHGAIAAIIARQFSEIPEVRI